MHVAPHARGVPRRRRARAGRLFHRLRRRRTGWPLAVALFALAGPAVAQELPFRGPVGITGVDACGDLRRAGEPAATQPGNERAEDADQTSEEARAQAVDLVRDADRAVILGDLQRARSFLDRAAELDPGSADIAYRRARVLEDLGERAAAIDGYCAAARAEESGRGGGRADARERAERLQAHGAPAGVSDAASAAFARGMTAAREGRYGASLVSLDAALREAPRWPDAIYNRGVALARMGRHREAASELRRYLSEAPASPDVVDVSRRIGQLEIMAERAAPSAGTAFTLGLLFPGLGQFYTGRVVEGATVLALAGSAVAAGYLVKEVHVRCLETVAPGEGCPPGLVASRTARRPHLTPALAVAGGILALGAVEALIGARRRPEPDGPFVAAAADGALLPGPSLTVRGEAVDLNLLTLRFR